MNRRPRTLLVLAGAVLVAALAGWLLLPRTVDPAAVARRVRWQITVNNPTGEPVSNTEVRLFAPRRESAWQRLDFLSSQPAFVAVDDQHGNSVLRYTLDLPPYGSAVISAEAAVSLFTASRPEGSGDPAGWLASEQFIESDSPDILAAAAPLRRSDPAATMRAVYDWVVAHLQEAPYAAQELGAHAALFAKRGDCTEYSDLTIALGRALGVPARLAAGFRLTDRPTLTAADYHNWAEAYWDGRWHLIDGIFKKFDSDTESYITFRIRGAAEEPANSERFSTADPRLRIEMR